MELRMQNCRLLPKGPFRRQHFHFTARLLKGLGEFLCHIGRDQLGFTGPMVGPRAHLDLYCPPDVARRYGCEAGRILEQQRLLVGVFFVVPQ